MKIGMIGLGDIAKKAYLPVITTRPDVELSICTRNEAVLRDVGTRYRIPANCRFNDVSDLIDSNIEAAFVHTATEAHFEIVQQLLAQGIHVYVDKPIDYFFARSAELVELAKEKKCALMVGFNRRFAPAYRNIALHGEPDLVLMQKNRVGLAAEVRKVILDDFIHVVDTLRFYCPKPHNDIQVRFKMEGTKLAYVVVELCGSRYTAIGVMNRESGITEEVLEVIGIGEKWKVTDVRDTVYYRDGEHKTKMGDWVSVGMARGFEAIVEAFLSLVKEGSPSDFISVASDHLRTHEICEQIVRNIEGGS